jgi:hypothetical protein
MSFYITVDEEHFPHNINGPALTSNGVEYWYVHGSRCFTLEEFQQKAKLTDDQITILKLKYGPIKSYQFLANDPIMQYPNFYNIIHAVK